MNDIFNAMIYTMDALQERKPLNSECLLGSKPVSVLVGPFGLCTGCHDAFCPDGKTLCEDCESVGSLGCHSGEKA